MESSDREPLIAICLLAALADGERPAPEQEEFTRILSRLGGGDTARVSSRVQSGELTAAGAAQQLSSPEARRLAYELAVAIVYADGDANSRERSFLDGIHRLLGLGGEATSVEAETRSLALAPPNGPAPSLAVAETKGARPSQAGIPAMSHDAALDLLIRQQALLAGALELLPQNLASLAIIPIQMRMVYRIGADYGQKLDADQIKDLLGAMGIGAAAQLLDGAARRVIGGIGRGLLGRIAGGLLGGAAGAVAGVGLGFVTTYALGHAARQYYAQGRRLSRDDLRTLFERFRGEGEALLPKVQAEMHAQAEHLDLGRLLATVRGTS